MSKKNRSTDRTSRAAAALAEQQRAERRRRNLMVGGVVAALVLVVGAGFLLSRSLDKTGDVDAPAAGSRYGLTVGPKDAPNEVVVYEDFLCPFCGEFERASHTRLKKLADEGKVRVEYRPLDFLSRLGDYSARSTSAFSVVLDKAGADVALEFHRLLFEEQPKESGPFLTNDDLVRLAVKAGAKEADVKAGIEQQAGKSWADAATQAADAAGVSSTPTILLNGKYFDDGRTVDQLADNLIDELK